MNVSVVLLTGGLAGFLLLPSLGCAAVAAGERAEPTAPEQPRAFVDTMIVPSNGRTIEVKAGDDLQQALDRAEPGDTILLEPGARFIGPFSLPNKPTGRGWITVRTAAPDRQLPPPGTRVRPADASSMPKLVARRGDGVIHAEQGAHHYRLIGLEITPSDGTYLYSLVWFGHNRDRSVEDLPHHLIVDRCFIHGDPAKGSRRGIALNGRSLAVIDSHLSDFKEVGGDSQAIMGWGGPGPFKIVNNYLEGAGENLMFGGGDPSIRDLVPSDIEIRQNHMVKPLAWKRGEPGFHGTAWTIKNIFELKNARRVIADGNVLEHNWQESQNGFAVLLTVRNQDGKAPWSVVEDVRFTNNVIRHSGSGLNLLGRDDNHPSEETKRILIENNYWEDIGGARWGGTGILFQLMNGSSDVAVQHNTGLQKGMVLFALGRPNRRFAFRDNVAPHNEYGIFGNDVGTGASALDAYFPQALVTGNVLAGGNKRLYPEGNSFPASLDVTSLAKGAPTIDRPSGTISADPPGSRQPGVDRAELCYALGPLAAAEPLCGRSTLAAGDVSSISR